MKEVKTREVYQFNAQLVGEQIKDFRECRQWKYRNKQLLLMGIEKALSEIKQGEDYERESGREPHQSES